jgi:hypothetical protein
MTDSSISKTLSEISNNAIEKIEKMDDSVPYDNSNKIKDDFEIIMKNLFETKSRRDAAKEAKVENYVDIDKLDSEGKDKSKKNDDQIMTKKNDAEKVEKTNIQQKGESQIASGSNIVKFVVL